MPAARGPGQHHDAWRRDAAKELVVGCGKLAEAAKRARAGTIDPDHELGILAEEVIDIATRGLVVTAQVGADVLDDHPAHLAAKHADVAVASVPTVMGLALSDTSKRDWPRAAAPLLQAAVAPLTRAVEHLAGHRREYSEEVTVLREETIDIEARLAGADARVATEPKPRSQLSGAKGWLARLEGYLERHDAA